MKTDVVKTSENSITVRGTPIAQWALGLGYFQAFADLHGLTDDAATRCERVAILFCDHGINPPSTVAARLAASCGSGIQNSMIAALACMAGDYHVQAVLRAAKFLSARVGGERLPMPANIPGLGHQIHSDDPRVAVLISAFGDGSAMTELRAISKATGIPVNIAGACAAALVDAGLPIELTPVPVILGRMLGISVHWREQANQNQKSICYDGERFMED